MKRKFIFGALCLTLMASCTKTDNNAQEAEAQQQLVDTANAELQQALAERSEMIDLMNGVIQSIDSINAIEHIITINGVGEGSRRTQLQNDLAAIKATLAERRQKLADLEAKLSTSKTENSKLLSTIESLKKQIDSKEKQIAELNTQLKQANEKIAELNTTVESLNTEVEKVTEQRDAAQKEATRQANEAAKCYVAVGTKKELKDHNILESGFLRKTKVMDGDFDKSFFMVGDKRTLTGINLHAKKAKVLTNQPASSYQIVDINGEKVLKVLDPQAFWGVTNYVVVQVD